MTSEPPGTSRKKIRVPEPVPDSELLASMRIKPPDPGELTRAIEELADSLLAALDDRAPGVPLQAPTQEESGEVRSGQEDIT